MILGLGFIQGEDESDGFILVCYMTDMRIGAGSGQSIMWLHVPTGINPLSVCGHCWSDFAHGLSTLAQNQV